MIQTTTYIGLMKISVVKACCYSVLSVCCLYMKTFHMKEFFAATLSVEEKEEKRVVLCSKLRKNGIAIKIPDINKSSNNFEVVNGEILYGLSQIKGVGKAKLPIIIKNQPYTSLEDAYNKNIIDGKKYFDKKTGEALIKAGAFDFEDTNRNRLLNKFIDIRKDKKAERYNENAYCENTCMEYEIGVLGSSISHEAEWDSLEPGKTIKIKLCFSSIQEKIDKNGNMMAFVKADIFPYKDIDGIIFASTYCRNADLLNPMVLDNSFEYPCRIKKDENGKKFIITKIYRDEINTIAPSYNIFEDII